MSENSHTFQVKAKWNGYAAGDGVISTETQTIDFGLPAQMGGLPGRLNPEELFASALGSCYLITLASIAGRRKLPIEEIELRVECKVATQADKSLKITAIQLFPRILMKETEDWILQAVKHAAIRAEEMCLVSKAVRGNVEVTVTPELDIIQVFATMGEAI
jgi:peroxiredoxin-like protein